MDAIRSRSIILMLGFEKIGCYTWIPTCILGMPDLIEYLSNILPFYDLNISSNKITHAWGNWLFTISIADTLDMN